MACRDASFRRKPESSSEIWICIVRAAWLQIIRERQSGRAARRGPIVHCTSRYDVIAKNPLRAFLAEGRIRNPLFLLSSVFCHLSSVGRKMTFCTRLRYAPGSGQGGNQVTGLRSCQTRSMFRLEWTSPS